MTRRLPRLTRTLPLAPLVLVLLAAGAQHAESLDALTEWLRSYRRGRIELDAEEVSGLRNLVSAATEVPKALEGESAPTPAESAEADGRTLERALLELAGLDLAARPRRGETPNRFLPNARAVGDEALARLLDREDGGERFAWLTREVLGESKADLGSRIAAARGLVGRYREATLDVLLATAGDRKEPELARASLEALVGWPEERVTEHLVAGVRLGEEPGPVPIALLRRHLEGLQEAGALGPETEAAIRELVRGPLTSDAWRAASRGLELLVPLTGDEVYPLLIGALEAWTDRRAEKLGTRRIEHDIASELTRRSGRAIGNHADRWRHWWTLVQEGKVAPPPTAEELEDMSRAAFFSLRPMTERVTLVVDRSGSMSAPFGPDLKQSRYGMAIDQTINFLRVSGETTRFNVFLFSDATLRYKPRLQPADERNLEALRRWMEENGPGGGTHLKDAILEALELRRDGTVDVDRLESDTIIVLCDGDTIAGPDWVRGTVDAIRERARLVFHCVQIGDDGDGTLEQLAESTGGDFIHIAR